MQSLQLYVMGTIIILILKIKITTLSCRDGNKFTQSQITGKWKGWDSNSI